MAPLNDHNSSRNRLRKRPTGHILSGRPAEGRFIIQALEDSPLSRLELARFSSERRIRSSNIFYASHEVARNLDKAAVDEGCLDRVTIHDTLYLNGHGNKDRFFMASGAGGDSLRGLTSQQLAEYLSVLGLKQVGIVKIKACNIGSGDYLEELSKCLEKEGINHGYCSGPTGIFTSFSNNPNALHIGKGGAVTKNINFGAKSHRDLDKPERRSELIKRSIFKALNYVPIVNDLITISQKERFHLKVVEGPCAVSFPGTRYTKNSRSINREIRQNRSRSVKEFSDGITRLDIQYGYRRLSDDKLVNIDVDKSPTLKDKMSANHSLSEGAVSQLNLIDTARRDLVNGRNGERQTRSRSR